MQKQNKILISIHFKILSLITRVTACVFIGVRLFFMCNSPNRYICVITHTHTQIYEDLLSIIVCSFVYNYAILEYDFLFNVSNIFICIVEKQLFV